MAPAKWDDPDGVSRRDVLVYGGGSYLFGGLVLGGVWWGVFRDRAGPAEEVVREYVEALDRSQFFTAAGLFHEDAPDPPPSPSDLPDIGRLDLAVESTEVLDRDADPEVSSVREFALVRTEVSVESAMESDTLGLDVVVAKNGAGDWKIWSDTLGDGSS